MKHRSSLAVLVLCALASSSAGVSAIDDETVAEEIEESVLVGSMTRAEIEEAMPGWVGATVESSPDEEASVRLADLVTTARVTAYFGSWCSDSERELARLWKALDLAGGEAGFPLEYVAVDRDKAKPADRVSGKEILYVPTFVVEQGETEIGRIIEQSPGGIESDLASILEGSATGWISARDDLPARGDGKQP